MSKKNETKALQDEQRIISLFQTNSHESIDVIATKCGFSRQKIWRFIKKLEE